MWADQSAFVSLIPKPSQSPPGRDRQAGCFLEKRIPSFSAGPLFWEINSPQWERRLSKIYTSPLSGAGWIQTLLSRSAGVLQQLHTVSLYHSRILTANYERLSSLLMECMWKYLTPLLAYHVQNKGVKNSPRESYLLAKSLTNTHHRLYVNTAAWSSTVRIHNECTKLGVRGARIVHKTMGQLGPHDASGWRDEGLLGLSPPPLFLYH